MKNIIYLIYLLSTETPSKAIIFAANEDSVYYYTGKEYTKKRILDQKEKKIYTFDNGYIHIRKSKLMVYKFQENKPVVYKIKFKVDNIKDYYVR